MSGIILQSGMMKKLGVDFLANLVAYWKMEETSGNILDSVNSYDMQPRNAPTLGATGKNNNCVSFNGTNEYLRLASLDNSELDFTGAFSLSAWVNTDDLSSTRVIIAKDGTSIRQYFLAYNSVAAGFRFLVSDNGTTTYVADTTTPLSTNTWYHVFACYDPSNTLRIYLNGELEGENTTSIPASLYSSSNYTTIAVRQNSGGNYWDGEIDELAIWNAYKPELASALYNAGAGKFYDDF